ncbi:MAG: hypothetical protein ACTSYE_12330, partial [Alphaproteobacteria bacterium]
QAVIAHVGEGRDLGLIARGAASPWWRDLDAENGPLIMAILPFITGVGGLAALPAFVIAPRLAEPPGADVSVFAVSTDGPLAPPQDLVTLAGEATAGAGEWLLADLQGRSLQAVQGALETEATAVRAIKAVGGFARPITPTGQAVTADQLDSVR